jgi:hypothetical protein
MKTSRVGLSGVIAALCLCATANAVFADDVKVMLSGGNEVPPVTTMAKGEGMIIINADKTVSGSVTTSGIAGTMAHIHLGAMGTNGPVIIPLAKDGDGKWMVPAGAKLTDEQYKAFESGQLYVNVHSAEHKGGEIRGQLAK